MEVQHICLVTLCIEMHFRDSYFLLISPDDSANMLLHKRATNCWNIFLDGHKYLKNFLAETSVMKLACCDPNKEKFSPIATHCKEHINRWMDCLNCRHILTVECVLVFLPKSFQHISPCNRQDWQETADTGRNAHGGADVWRFYSCRIFCFCAQKQLLKCSHIMV